MGYFVKNRRLQSGSSGVVLPAGGSDLRPDNPAFGMIRYNTDLAAVEFFNGATFDQLSAAGDVTYTVDTFTGDGSTTDFVMSVAETSPSQIMVFVGSIYQEPTIAYTVSAGYNISFTSAPGSSIPINVIHSET